MTEPSSGPLSDASALTSKSKARDIMSAKRAALSAADRQAAAQAVANHFADHPYLTYAESFAGYYPMRDELDVLPIFNRMVTYRKHMALPCIPPSGDLLLFRLWSPNEPLEPGTLGFQAPPITVPAIIPAIVLVPLLAFNADGFRLGYGGGYYDRVISHYRTQRYPTLFFGVAYSIQEDSLFPIEAHDEKLDGILTEHGVSMFNRQVSI